MEARARGGGEVQGLVLAGKDARHGGIAHDGGKHEPLGKEGRATGGGPRESAVCEWVLVVGAGETAHESDTGVAAGSVTFDDDWGELVASVFADSAVFLNLARSAVLGSDARRARGAGAEGRGCGRRCRHGSCCG